MVRNKILAECKFILTGDEANLKRIRDIVDYFITLAEPKNLDGNSSENYIILQRKNFEQICLIMMEHGIQDPDSLTVLRFHMAIKYLEEKNKPKRD